MEKILLYTVCALNRMITECEDKNDEIKHTIINDDIINKVKINLIKLSIDGKFLKHFDKINELNYLENYFTIKRILEVLSKQYSNFPKCFSEKEYMKICL